jgi:ribosomal protein S8
MISNIIYNDKIFKIKLDHDLQVKDVITNFQNDNKYCVDLVKNKETRLLNEFLEILEDEDFISSNSNIEKTFYLFQTERLNIQLQKFLETQEPIEDLITKVTDAKEKLQKMHKPNLSLRRSTNFIRIHSIFDPNNYLRNSRNESYRPLAIFTMGNINLNNIDGLNYNIHSNFNENVSNEIVVDESLVAELQEMGFPEDKCKRALEMARNNIDRATDILLNDELDYIQSNDIYPGYNDEQDNDQMRMEVDDYFDYNEVNSGNSNNYLHVNHDNDVEIEDNNQFDDEEMEENTENENDNLYYGD